MGVTRARECPSMGQYVRMRISYYCGSNAINRHRTIIIMLRRSAIIALLYLVLAKLLSYTQIMSIYNILSAALILIALPPEDHRIAEIDCKRIKKKLQRRMGVKSSSIHIVNVNNVTVARKEIKRFVCVT